MRTSRRPPRVPELEAHLDSAVAGSVVQGEGQWSLTADYPGSMQVSFKRLDLERLRLWLRGKQPPGGIRLNGFVEGTLTVAGPAIQPELWKAELRIPSLQVGPEGTPAEGQALALHNQSPIVIRMERDIVKVESARIDGRATDLSLTGTVDFAAEESAGPARHRPVRSGQPAGFQSGYLSAPATSKPA